MSTRGSLGAAGGAIAVVFLFVAVTCWWLSRDAAVQFGGGASHIYASMIYRDFFVDGEPFRAFELSTYYPPGVRLLGALALSVGGMSVAAPVLAQNLVFVPLLALACFQVGRLAAGPWAGLLAVVFALGTPLIAEQFHVFMLDAPQAALVAVAVWLLLASERFARTDLAALAGVVVGLGVLTKQFMPLYLVGLLAALLLRGEGWRNWRGIAAFCGAALVVGAPWYVEHLGEFSRFAGAAGSGSETEPVPDAATPPLLSLGSLGWYFWATLNGLLLAPLFAIAAVGVATAAVRTLRTRPRPPGDVTVELLWGLAGAWLVISLLPHHDVRYTMGLIVYLAVLGTAWMVRLRPRPRLLAVTALVLAVVAAQLGATVGVGRSPGQLPLSNGLAMEGEGVPPRDRVVVYSSLDYLVSGPRRSGDVLGLMRDLREHEGVGRVAWEDEGDVNDHLFEGIGLVIFARIAGIPVEELDPLPATPVTTATLVRSPMPQEGEPCTRLANGDGVWVRLDVPGADESQMRCPEGA